MFETKKHPIMRKAFVLLMAVVMLAAYMPRQALQAYAVTKASVYDGRTLKGSDGRPYYPNNKGGGYYYAKFSNAKGDGFVYRLARATSAKKTIVVDSGKSTYAGYCLEHGAWMNAGATGYSAEKQEELEKLQWMKPYSESTRKGMRLALLFGKQPGHTQKDVPVEGCNLDDWYWATQNIIWEFQQGLRTSVTSGLKSRTGKYAMDANWFRDTVKGRPAEKIYNWMLSQMKKYVNIPSWTADTTKKIRSQQTIKLQPQDNGTWTATVTDSRGIGQDIKSTNKHIKIKRSGNEYTITCDVDPKTITKPILAKKNIDVSKPKQDLLVWSTNQKSPVADSNHLQTVATGGDDPVDMYFKVTADDTPPPPPGEPKEPKLPSFELDVEKLDKNPGFDSASGTSHTGMGDAALDATIDLMVDGEVIESKTLDVNGYSDEPFYFIPWEDVSELEYEKVETEDEETGEVTVDHYWRGSKTVSTVESGVPDGRFEDENGGTHDHGTITYYAHCTNDGPMEYNITYENGALTDEADIDLDNPQPMLDDKDDKAFINDNFRGTLQIVKTKTDLDPFTNNGSGKLEYSVNSKWTIQLISGGYEDQPYIRVQPIKEGDPDYDKFANCYRVVCDNSGVAADEEHPLTVSKFGQIRVADLPYGNYLVKEISADSNGYVLESHEISVTYDGQLISTDTDNVPKQNKVQIIKTNSETGKTVRLDENAAFRIRYMGNPDLADPTTSPNYGRYLPNGSGYTDGDASSKNNYIFKCDKNGQIVLPYQLEYGNYQLEEVTVPEGYFVGAYNEKGEGSNTEMPKDFKDAVVVYDSAGGKVTDFTNNGKVIFNKYKFSVTEQTPHQDGKDYVTYYLTVKMPNNPVKGRIEITKTGESLAGWLKDKFSGNEGYSAVWDKTGLKDTTFNVYAADDVLQVDGVQRIKAFDSKDDKEVELEEVTRDLSNKDNAKSFWQKLLDTGEKILRWIGLDIGDDNECKTEYVAKAEKGASYSIKHTEKENGVSTTYDIEYTLNYTKGGMNYTDIHVKKDQVADDYVAKLDESVPKLESDENTDVGILNLILENKNMVKLNKETINEYGEDDISAKIMQPMTVINPMDEDADPDAEEGWTLKKKANCYLETKEVQDVDENDEPLVDETTGEPVMKTVYKIYVNDNGSKKWIDCNEEGEFKDVNSPESLPEGFEKTDKSGMYQVSRIDAQIEETMYMVWVVEDGKGRWVICDADGNFYKSHYQEYDIILSQHFDCSDGWKFTFDGLVVDALADHEAQKAQTIITNPWKEQPVIVESSAYTHETADNITTFTAEPKDLAPVYFKTNDGIKTSMIYQGGHTVTTIEVMQSQLYFFGQDSKPADTTSVEKIFPMIEYTNEEETELIEWCKDLTADNDKFERVFDENNFIKVIRHEVSPENKDEVKYEIIIVSDNETEDKGFKVTYPDTTVMQPVNSSDDDAEAGRLIFTSIEGTMIYPIGSPVCTITTDENGIASTPNLPLGKYYIQEVESANGHVNNGQWREFDLQYKDQYTPMIWETADLDNEAVSVKIDLSKLFETAYGSKEYQLDGGAVFGIFSAEEITAATKTDKKIDAKKIDADTLVGTLTVRSDGKGTVVAKLPPGKYYIKEISAPEGYKLNGTKYYFHAVDILTADQLSFAYKDIGVTGLVTQDGNNNTIVQLESLYSKPMNKITINGNEYDLLHPTDENGISISVLKGRTNTRITIKDGQSAAIKFENGAVMTYKAEGQTYTATLDGKAPTELSTGADGNENFTKETDGSKTVIKYQPKVTKTNWLSEVTYKYEAPKNMETGEGGFTAIQPANKILALTSPEGTSEVTASVDYAYAAAQLTLSKGTVSSVTVDDKAVDPADYADGIRLERIVKTPVMIDDPENPGEKIQKTDKDGNLLFDTKIQSSKAVINFEDGVAYTVTLDKSGQLDMSASGEVDKDLEAESTLTVDGKQVTADNLASMKLIDLKNTTAKTYARNNTNAGVLNITVNKVKNDRLPETPTTPDNPGPTPTYPTIRTTAKDSDTLDHIARADGKVTIIDTVSYTGLTPDQEYTLHGVLMDKETGKVITADGREVTAEKKFTPKTSSGKVDMEFTFDGSALAGKTTVVYEELYKFVVKNEGSVVERVDVAEHKDLNDEGQTVYFPEIKTSAANTATGVITDIVTYRNLIPGKIYTVKGVLMDKETGEPILADGRQITAEKEFTPEKSSGTVDMTFGFKQSDLYGKTTVVFEELYLNEIRIANHKDINDKDQTVKIDKPEVPGTPGNPGKLGTPGTPGTPQTGDSNNMMLHIGLMAAALALITLLIAYRRRQNREE